MMNREYSTHIIQKLLQWGVEEFYVCAGARDIPLIEVVCSIQSDKKIVFNHFEERSAAFYALGRIKSLKKPVAVITTSGTAVGELLPAVMEAHYSGLPLVLLTADRPKNYRGTGAPQSAEQQNIFGCYVSKSFDLEIKDNFEIKEIKKNKPIHINICFDTPLQSGEIKPLLKENVLSPFMHNTNEHHNSLQSNIEILKIFLQKNKKILLIVSQIFEEEKSSLIQFILKMNYPVYIESISNLRECPEINHLKLKCGDQIWTHSEQIKYNFDAVIKIGATPTHRLWRDLDEIKKQIPVLSISELPFSGMPNAEQITTNLNFFFSHINSIHDENPILIEVQNFIALDNLTYTKIKNLFFQYPQAEQSLYFHLSQCIKKNSRVYLGNSLPIRYWDFAATFEQNNLTIDASRGLNGIDGQISSFLGFADETSQQNLGIFGDLTTLYDLAGLWMLQQRPALNVDIVVLNNGGGRIFSKVLKGEISLICQNVHSHNFEGLAKLWNLHYEKVFNINEISEFKGQRIIEIIPNTEQGEQLNAQLKLI